METQNGEVSSININEFKNQATVLLISDNQEDYDRLVEYGFKNIDYFKSVIRADNYFRKHPNELKKYQIIIKGNQNVQHCCNESHVLLDRKIWELDCVTSELRIIQRWNWESKDDLYKKEFDNIVGKAMINEVARKQIKRKKEFVSIPDYVNPERLPLPTKKSDLKILYLDSVKVNKYAEEIAKQLRLNITFRADSNSAIGRHVKSNLGEYDIIIASDCYSDSLIGMNNESTEQCKDTGRELTLLLTYDENYIPQCDEDGVLDFEGFGSRISVNYSYGGNLCNDPNSYERTFRILRRSAGFIQEETRYAQKCYENDVTCMVGIIGAAVNIYNDALRNVSEQTIEDLDIKSGKEFDDEYDAVERPLTEKKEKFISQMRSFENIRNTVNTFLEYRKKGLIKRYPKGLRITEFRNGIKVENIYDRNVFCSITFSKQYREKNLRVFDIETTSKKGTLGYPETVGIYSRKFEKLNSVPRRLDEKHANALSSIEKKVQFELLPIINEANNRQRAFERANSGPRKIKSDNHYVQGNR